MLDQTIHEGERMSTARAYLDPVAGRDNLVVQTGCLVNRVLFDGSRATGIEYRRRGREHTVLASEETIVCLGALASPKLLLLSGIGDPEALNRLGIEVRANVPAVGRYLQDHLDMQVQQTCTQPVTTTPALKLHVKAWIGLQWLLFRRGWGVTNHFEVGGYLRSHDGLRQPDLASWFMPLLVNYDGLAVGGGARLSADLHAVATAQSRSSHPSLGRPARSTGHFLSLPRRPRGLGGLA